MSLTIFHQPRYQSRRASGRYGAFGSMRFVRRAGVAITLLSLIVGSAAQAATVGEPVFDSPEYGQMQLEAGFAITGSAETNSEVELQIDGERVGRVQLLPSPGERASFAFTPAEPLEPGYHALEAFAKDPTGQKYARQSLWWYFHVKDPLPAPVILQTIERPGSRLTVEGVVRSGHRVRVYVDGVAVLTSEVLVHASGTRSFSLILPSLAFGTHTIAAAAVREDGRESRQSEPVDVMVTGTVVQEPIAKAPQKTVVEKPPPRQVAQEEIPTPEKKEAPLQPPQVQPQPKPEKEAVKPAPEAPPQVVILPPATATVAEGAVPSGVEGAPPAEKSRGQLIALVILGLLLVALIVWYATRRDRRGPRGDMPSSEASSRPAPPSGQSSLPLRETLPRGGAPSEEGSGEVDIPPPPPPPPPPPNFASRMDQY